MPRLRLSCERPGKGKQQRPLGRVEPKRRRQPQVSIGSKKTPCAGIGLGEIGLFRVRRKDAGKMHFAKLVRERQVAQRMTGNSLKALLTPFRSPFDRTLSGASRGIWCALPRLTRNNADLVVDPDYP